MKRVVLVVAAVALAGCAQPEAPPSPQLDPELGVAPTVSDAEPAPAAVPSTPIQSPQPSPSDPSVSPDVASSPPPPASPAPSSAPSVAAPPTEEPAAEPEPTGPVTLLAVADASGDHGARGPDWADLRSLELVEVTNDLRVTVRFGGELPAAPPEGEVPLVGVNIGDEGYQLFVEGGGQSWAAYLDTPDGFVEYPGTFELAGSAMVLQVPFNAVGSPTRAEVTAFAEWSRDSGTLGVLNPTSEDQLDGEPHTFDRSA